MSRSPKLSGLCGIALMSNVFLRLDLVYHFQTHPRLRQDILTKFHDYWTENEASRAYTRFFKDLTY